MLPTMDFGVLNMVKTDEISTDTMLYCTMCYILRKTSNCKLSGFTVPKHLYEY